MLGHIAEMSTHKYSSNVVEKCLQYGTPAQRDQIVSEVISGPSGDHLQVMMKDQFGNYVVQKVLEVGPHAFVMFHASLLASCESSILRVVLLWTSCLTVLVLVLVCQLAEFARKFVNLHTMWRGRSLRRGCESFVF